MSIQRIYNLSLVVLFITIIFLVWDGCEKDAQLSAFKESTKILKHKEQQFKNKIDVDKKLISEQKQIILSKDEALSEELLIINGFRKVDEQVKIVTKTMFDSIYVPFFKTDTIYLDNSFAFTDEYFGIYGESRKDGIFFDSVFFKNDLTLTIGTKSSGFLKRPEPIVQVKHNNPYTTTSSLNNIIIKNELKWYDKKRNWFFLGATIATFTTMFLIP